MTMKSGIEQTLVDKKVFIDISCFSHNKIREFFSKAQGILEKNNNHIIVISPIINYYINIEDFQSQTFIKEYVEKGVLALRGPISYDVNIDFVNLFKSFEIKSELALITQNNSLIKDIIEKLSLNKLTLAKITDDGDLEIQDKEKIKDLFESSEEVEKVNPQNEIKVQDKDSINTITEVANPEIKDKESVKESFESNEKIEKVNPQKEIKVQDKDSINTITEVASPEIKDKESIKDSSKTIEEREKDYSQQEIKNQEDINTDYEIKLVDSIKEIKDSFKSFNNTILCFGVDNLHVETKPYNLFLDILILFDNETKTKIQTLCTKGLAKQVNQQRKDLALLFSFCTVDVGNNPLLVTLGLFYFENENKNLNIDIPNANKILFEKEEYKLESLKMFNYKILTKDKIFSLFKNLGIITDEKLF